jgi:prepilin-type processing-associated H-X9-DG protein
MPDDACQVDFINEERVAGVLDQMASAETIFEVAEIFKLLADPTRARIINALSISELCVCEISAVLGMTQSAVSHQLRLLRAAKIVKFRKEGKMAYYSFVDGHVRSLFKEGLRHVQEG